MKKTVFLGDSILLQGYGTVIADRLADLFLPRLERIKRPELNDPRLRR